MIRQIVFVIVIECRMSVLFVFMIGINCASVKEV